ncbi:L-asparaginase [candidate division KSB1 bacterium 4484_87]|nr:MAG: L-asparaginase [candidate division KSB1 bacterium 4484_87]
MATKRIVVITTGGTIAMKRDIHSQTIEPSASGKELIDSVPDIKQFADTELIEFANIDSSEMSPQMMFELSRLIRKQLARQDVDGIVITHGTDTLEETAYMIDLLHDSPKPVVLTAAMRSFDDPGTDVPTNLFAAVKVACADVCRGVGTMVVMNDEIHAAREVRKTYTSNVATLESPGYGPLGIVDEDHVIIYRQSLTREFLPAKKIEPKVMLLKMSAGDDGSLIKFAVKSGAKGLVIEGLGRGNLPTPAAEETIRAIKTNIPVVLTSRCFKGRVLGIYGGSGGGKKLHDAGIIYGGDLSGQKARIKLIVALGLVSQLTELKKIFERQMY